MKIILQRVVNKDGRVILIEKEKVVSFDHINSLAIRNDEELALEAYNDEGLGIEIILDTDEVKEIVSFVKEVVR